VILGSVLALIAAGCSDDGSTSNTSSGASVSLQASSTLPAALATTAKPTTPEASITTLTFVDESRPTPATAESGESPERTLETWLYLPAADQPAPLIIFSHGMAGHPTKFERMHTAWRDAGYAVAAPAFPLTNDQITGGSLDAADVVNQPGDVVFVLDQLLAMNGDKNSDLFGRFDPEQLAAAGLSLGGMTTYAAAVDEPTRDGRFKAAIIQAGLIPNGDFVAPTDLPVLVMHGSADPALDHALALSSFESLNAPKIFVSMVDAWHADQFEDPENALTEKALEFHPLVDRTTTLFWDAYLRSEPTASPEDVINSATDPALTVVDSDLS
jgi:predicted dienelactone hydrolase